MFEEEKKLTRQRDRLNAKRRALPMIEIDKEYEFEGPDGKMSLLNLFQSRRQLIVYHFMFDPDWEEGCPSCSFLTDNIGHLSHLHACNTSLVLVSRAPLKKLQAYKKRMGWDIPWYSSFGSDFNYDFHVTLDPSVTPVEYNYEHHDGDADLKGKSMEGHGISVFIRERDAVFHTYSSYARGVDKQVNTYNFLDLTPLGRQENWEKPKGRNDGGPMHWLRRHDQYQNQKAEAE